MQCYVTDELKISRYHVSNSLTISENPKVIRNKKYRENLHGIQAQKSKGFLPTMLLKMNTKLDLILAMNQEILKGNKPIDRRFNASNYPQGRHWPNKSFQSKLGNNGTQNKDKNKKKSFKKLD
ncbi:hypothetical protein BpHYR1_032294 [Brachionus plicatilis]|uniref:Uncharacterized protein n=1 Tax=Brachionus plicatilis TaxID=10195 RepID=A0A3M7Q6A7_BRAPC|nr:hypothetical protein BpHYR1_032294 [Brachionus plicatilis]